MGKIRDRTLDEWLELSLPEGHPARKELSELKNSERTAVERMNQAESDMNLCQKRISLFEALMPKLEKLLVDTMPQNHLCHNVDCSTCPDKDECPLGVVRAILPVDHDSDGHMSERDE